MSAVSRIVRISDINLSIPPAEVEGEVRKIFSRDFNGFDIAVVKPKMKKARLAFLTFQSIQEAAHAIKLHSRLKLFGDPVRVAFDVSSVRKNFSPRSPGPLSTDVSDLLKQAKTLISHYNVDGDSGSRERGISSRGSFNDTSSLTKMPPSQTLFIGKLDTTIRKKDIEDALCRFGIIESIMIYNHNPSRVFAFVKFFNLFMARKTLKSMIGKRLLHLDCLFGYGQTALSNILWIGGIGPWIDIILLKKKFEEFGEVKNVEWPPDKNFAYIEFVSIRAAQKALEKMRGAALGKRRISIDFSDRSQMTSNLNYSDIYLGGDSDSEDEIEAPKVSKHSAPQIDFLDYNKEVDVYFDEIYRDNFERFAPRIHDRSPSREEGRSEYGRSRQSRRREESRHHSDRRQDFDRKFIDDFYAPIDHDFIDDKRSQEFDVGLKCTIKNDLYHGHMSPDKNQDRDLMDDYVDPRKRKDYDDRSVSSLPYKRHRSRDRYSRDAVHDKFPKDRYSRDSPSEYSARRPESPRRDYKDAFDFGRSPVQKSSPESAYPRSKYDDFLQASMPSKNAGDYADLKSSLYEDAKKFSQISDLSELRHREKWYPTDRYAAERSQFESVRGGGRSPPRAGYKAPAPHAVQMSAYENDLMTRSASSANNESIGKYPAVWTGGIVFKNKCYWTSMSLISGSIPLVNGLLNDALTSDLKLLKITQRLRLDMPEKLMELERRVDMAGRNGSSILLAFQANALENLLPGYDHQPLSKLNGFLKETQLAAVVLLPMERTFSSDKGVLHIFPRCQFSINFLQREAPELVGHFEGGDNLLMIVMKDMSQ